MKKKVRIVIALKGETGTGKSSLVNALLGLDIAPTGSSEACTSCVTEFSWNYDSDKPRCEIEFLTRQEWLAQIKIFQEDEEAAHEMGADDIRKALYPGLFTNSSDWSTHSDEEFCAYGKIAKRLDRTIRFDGNIETIDNFAKAMAKFIAPASIGAVEGKQQLWPIIKMVRVYLRADVLSTGAVIVDLPGVGDINPARNKIAATDELKADHLFVVAPQARAASGRGFTIFEESFAQTYKALRKIDSMAFIATRTGDFRQQEIVRASPAIAPQYNDLSAQIAALETSNAASDLEISEEEQEIGEATRRIRNARKKISRIDKVFLAITSSDDSVINNKAMIDNASSSEDSSSECQICPPVRNRLLSSENPGRTPFIKQFIKHEESDEEEITAPCTCNTFTLSQELNRAYFSYITMSSQELADIRKTVALVLKTTGQEKRRVERNISKIKKAQKARQLEIITLENSKKQLCSQERNRITRLGFLKNLNESLKESPEQHFSIPVFCTESVRNDSDCTLSTDTTGISSLRAYVKSLTILPQYRLSTMILHSALSLLSSISVVTGGKIQCVGGIQSSLGKKTPQLEGALKTLVIRSKLGWIDLALPLHKQISKAAIEGTTFCGKASNSLIRQKYSRLKAICLHHGDFTNKARKKFNINSTLMLPVRRNISDQWRILFSNNDVQHQFEKQIIDSFESTIRNLRKEIDLENLRDFNSFSEDIILQIKNIVQQSLADLAVRIADLEIDALSVLEDSAQSCLKETYIKCSLEKGTGAVARMCTVLSDFFKNNEEKIFEDASSQLEGKITEIEDSIGAVFETASKKCLTLFIEDFSYTRPTVLTDVSFARQQNFKIVVEAERSKVELLITKLGGIPKLGLFGIDEVPETISHLDQSASRKRKADNSLMEKSAKAKGKEKAVIQ